MNRRDALKAMLAGLLVPFVGLSETETIEVGVMPHGDTHALRGIGYEGEPPRIYLTGDDKTIYWTDDFYEDNPGGPTWHRVELP